MMDYDIRWYLLQHIKKNLLSICLWSRLRPDVFPHTRGRRPLGDKLTISTVRGKAPLDLSTFIHYHFDQGQSNQRLQTRTALLNPEHQCSNLRCRTVRSLEVLHWPWMRWKRLACMMWCFYNKMCFILLSQDQLRAIKRSPMPGNVS